MQRWIAARIAGTCAGGSNAGAPCTANGECPESVCASELVGDDPLQRGREYRDPQLLVPYYPAPGRPPVDRLITPALDWLAAEGNFWPIAHTSASVSQPAFTILMTGLYLRDLVLTASVPAASVNAVVPEWLPAAYLTLGAGKWQYNLSHVDPNGQPKHPWDREVGQSGNAGEGGRLILRPYAVGDPHAQALAGLALERIKDFIACATCTDPSKCLQPTAGDVRPDSARLAPRAEPGGCTPQPFYLIMSPFIPHLNYRFAENCPYFPRNAEQCALEPWKTHSLYCNDPTMDWSCDGYAATLEASVRPVGQRPLIQRRKMEYLKHINTFDRAIDELLVHLRCPGGGNPDCGDDLLADTVLLHTADHGFELTGSKNRFTEHSFRTPKVLYDPRPGNRLPTSPEGCGGQAGCRNDFAHAVDVLATIADLGGSTFTCNDACPEPCSASCPNACPCLRPDGQSPYVEGRSLRQPTGRTCATADPAYLQCLFGHQGGGQNIGTVVDGWYVLAEILDGGGLRHLCKLYVGCGQRLRLFDLRADPNEKATLAARPESFCGARLPALADLLRDELMDRGWYEPCFEERVP
jgi:hypothetical protein